MHRVPQDLLTSVRARSGRSRLLTADRYFREMENCFGGGACPAQLFESASTGDWRRALKEAESRLVWCDRAGSVDTVAASEQQTAARVPTAALEFDAVITTTRRDRDRDVMESSGADVDPQAVLLWQHVPLLPIGRLVEVIEQTSSLVKARLAIADTALGRDAATLAAFGALRISHGFQPLDFEALPDEGWHFKKFEILEISLVSVPSNRDAVITALGRDKLHSTFIKQWATALHRSRPVLGRGTKFDSDCKRNEEVKVQGNVEPTAPNSMCSCRQKSTTSGSNDESLAELATSFLAAAAQASTSSLKQLKTARRRLNRIIKNVETARTAAKMQSLADALSGQE